MMWPDHRRCHFGILDLTLIAQGSILVVKKESVNHIGFGGGLSHILRFLLVHLQEWPVVKSHIQREHN